MHSLSIWPCIYPRNNITWLWYLMQCYSYWWEVIRMWSVLFHYQNFRDITNRYQESDGLCLLLHDSDERDVPPHLIFWRSRKAYIKKALCTYQIILFRDLYLLFLSTTYWESPGFLTSDIHIWMQIKILPNLAVHTIIFKISQTHTSLLLDNYIRYWIITDVLNLTKL